MDKPLFTVRVPATTANIGPGYDSVGMALSLYMTVEVRESATGGWSVRYDGDEYAQLPADETNLIIRTIMDTAERYGQTCRPLSLLVTADIPLGKGMGSSAAAIAAGIMIADEYAGLRLSLNEKVRIASETEGHADNVAPALAGGIMISYFAGETLQTVRLPAPDFGAVILLAPAALKTSESRALLPSHLTHSQAAAASAAGNVLVAALSTGDYETAGAMMEYDLLHEPYRAKHLPHFQDIRSFCKQAGAYGTAISGAGPSLFIAVRSGTEEKMADMLSTAFPHYQAIALQPSKEGSTIKSGGRLLTCDRHKPASH